jgi:hypothetical protein
MEKLNTIFHIGFPKTGTTWFQYDFFPYIENAFFLPRAELLRPRLMQKDPFSFNKILVQKELQERFIRSQKRVLVLSDEGFLARNLFFIKDFAYRIKSVCPNSQIIIFIRNQESMLASMYSQYIKSNGGTFSLKRYLFGHPMMTEMTNSISFHTMKLLRYDQIIKLYKNLFGKENVHIFLFEDFIKDPKLFCQNFSKQFDFEINLENLSYNKKNKGLRSGLILLQRFLNCFTANWRYEKYYIIHIPNFHKITFHIIRLLNQFRIFGNSIKIKKLLNKTQYHAVLDYYKESNRKLIEEHGLKDIEKYGYPL